MKAHDQPYDGKCVECRKARTVCIHVRVSGNMGHAAITLGDGTNFTAYGNWPVPTRQGGRGQGRVPLSDNSVQQHSSEDPASAPNNPERDKRYAKSRTKCKTMDEKQEEALKKYLANKSYYNLATNNCATWASGAWAAAGGSTPFGGGTFPWAN